MRTQDCRQLKTKRVKKRPTGFAAATEVASSTGVPPVGALQGEPRSQPLNGQGNRSFVGSGRFSRVLLVSLTKAIESRPWKK
eukprot:1360285-Amphidinium_carterae.4